ncbi:baseplate hub protein [Pseudomonas plecoglossicida]|uniref:baseplate hub protein n=1 Tax=Pseudomonas plecoglossicida TaxID=70775 RepID=UPI003D1C0C53
MFDIDISPGDAISFADIRLYNINKESAVAQGSSIVFRAGYTDNIDAVFTGYVTNVLREREPGAPEITTRLICRSGQPAVDRASAQISFGVGTRIEEVLRALARAWPLPIEIDNSQFADAKPLASGLVVDGDIPSAFTDLSYAYKFDWMQDRGRIVITKPDLPRTASPVKVDQLSGMIGIPEISRGPDGLGVFVSVQLNPSMRINGKINVESEFATFNTGNLYVSEVSGDASANGEYNVFALKHSGDSHGDAWKTEIDGLRAGTTPPLTQSATPENGKLIWGARVDQAFRVKTREIAGRQSIDPNWLMAVMGFETGYTFSPAARNPGSSATGLIQFIESTAVGLGTTTAQLARMTAVRQLDYVEAYYQTYAGRIRNLGDAYLAVLWPVAVGRPDSYVMWERDTGPYQREYAANSGLDVNRDGKITRGEAVASVNTAYMRGQQFVR